MLTSSRIASAMTARAAGESCGVRTSTIAATAPRSIRSTDSRPMRANTPATTAYAFAAVSGPRSSRSPGRRCEATTNGMSTDGDSRWWTTWNRSSGSPEKSLSMITRARAGGNGLVRQEVSPSRHRFPAGTP